jgi:RNA polymerase sigma-70 factor (ECF subfamily)
MAAMSAGGITPPVGFSGEFRMTSLVRSESRSRNRLRSKEKPRLLFERHRYRPGAQEPDHRFVNRKARIGVDDLVAGFQQRHHGEENDGLAAGHHRYVLWPNRNPARPRNVGGDGFPQLGIALRRAVMGPALIERFLGCFDDVGRSGEIGFADLQVDHAAALGFERVGAYQDIEGGFDSDAAHSFCEFHSNYQAYQASPRAIESVGKGWAGCPAPTLDSTFSGFQRHQFRTRGNSRLQPDERRNRRARLELLERQNRFVSENLRRVFIQIYRIVGNVADAQDLTQEAFIKALQRQEQLKDEQKAAHWLSRIATNTAIDFLRRSGRATFCELDEAPASQLESPEQAVLRSEERNYLEDGLRLLSPRERAALMLRDVEGLPAEEVARRLNCSKATVRSHIANARTKFRRYIERRKR